jgi:biotin-[acetyl-CoA-carboxylase] ligase BirA-like protein
MTLFTFDSLDSTSTYLKLHAHEHGHLTVVRARYQTFGRGQFDRKWQANPNENLLFSILLKPVEPIDLKRLEWMVIQTLLTFLSSLGIEASHKLPNDILIKGKKVCGMLIETFHEGSTLSHVILGIGLNVNQLTFSNLPNATSIALATQKTYDIDPLFSSLIRLFEHF